MGVSQGKRLTSRRIDSLRAGDRTYRLADQGAPAGGLLLEVRPTGGKSWISRVTVARGRGDDGRRLPGRRIDVTVGAWPVTSIEAAHAEHVRNKRLAASGFDPRHDRLQRQQAPRFGELMERWLVHIEAHHGLAARTIAAHRRRWRLYLSRLDGVLLAQLTRQVIAPELTRAAEKAPAQARACLSTVRSALEWAVNQGWVDSNPAADMRAAAYGAQASRPRTVTLDLGELRQLWATLEGSALSPAMVSALCLLILTGARRAEVAGMRIEELDLVESAWHIPADRAKTSTARTVYLSPLAVEILEARVGSRQDGPVFIAPGQTKALTPDSLTTAVRRLRGGPLAAMAARKPFTVHDLRRSAATCWGEHLDARPELIDRMLGHARRNPIEAAYQHQTYERQQRAMIAAWGAMIEDQVARKVGENVVPMRHGHCLSGVRER